MILSRRSLRENIFLDADSLYGAGAPYFLRMVDWSTEDSPSLTEVERAAFHIRRLTYNALGQGIRDRSPSLYKLDQCELLRKFLSHCVNLEHLSICRLPGVTWINLTTRLTMEHCPKLEMIHLVRCSQTVDVLQADYLYSPAKKLIPVPFMAVSMKGNARANFDSSSDALLWPFSEQDVEQHIAWIARYTPLLTGKALIWAQVFLKK
jgi:hypothetical protein